MRYLEKSWWTFLIKSSSFVQSESKLIHFFESRFLDESKLIHSGVYVNLYVYPPWLSSLWTGTCFASIACGHPHAHFWGVPQTPALFLRDDSDADDANDAVLGISLYHIPDSASLASSASFRFCVFRSIIAFSFFNGKPQASFRISVTVVTMVTVFLAYPYPYPINIVTTVTIVT